MWAEELQTDMIRLEKQQLNFAGSHLIQLSIKIICWWSHKCIFKFHSREKRIFVSINDLIHISWKHTSVLNTPREQRNQLCVCVEIQATHIPLLKFLENCYGVYIWTITELSGCRIGSVTKDLHLITDSSSEPAQWPTDYTVIVLGSFFIGEVLKK